MGLERRELVNQVGVSGVVESAQGMQVYSTVSSTVNTVNVNFLLRLFSGKPRDLLLLACSDRRLRLDRYHFLIVQLIRLILFCLLVEF